MTNVTDARKRLADPLQAVRDAAAAELRAAYAADPAAAGVVDEAFWKNKLAAIPRGVTPEQLEGLIGAKSEGATGSGGTMTVNYRLDDHWTVVAIFDHPGGLRDVGELSRAARDVWVEPPKGFSGRWVTYFATGVVAHDIQYSSGKYRKFTAYHDNGQLAYEQRYVDGEIDGVELGFHRNGKRAYEGTHAMGKRIGRWVHWYESGAVESESTYVDGLLEGPSITWRENGTMSVRREYHAGQETGQASWDEQGKLLFSHGSLERAP